MSDVTRHVVDELGDALDGRLTPEALLRLEAHLADCVSCRATRGALEGAKAAAARLRTDDLPEEVRERALRTLRAAAPRMSASAGDEVVTSGRSGSLPWRWLATAAVLAGLAVWTLWPSGVATSAPALAAKAFREYDAGQLRLDVNTPSVEELDAYFARAGLSFPVRVLDLGMMEYRVQGGRVHAVGEAPSALFVYRGPEGQVLVCQMYEGLVSALPASPDRRVHNDIEFMVYDEGGITVVFWQEGEVVCVLAGRGPRDEVVQLAYAKAMKV